MSYFNDDFGKLVLIVQPVSVVGLNINRSTQAAAQNSDVYIIIAWELTTALVIF